MNIGADFQEWFPSADDEEFGKDFLIPYWLIVLCYLPPWLGLSVWRAQRIGKMCAALK